MDHPLNKRKTQHVDGAVFAERNKVGVNCILRDDRGSAMMPTTKLEEFSMDLLEIELIAIFKRLQLCIPLGIHNLVWWWRVTC